MIFGRDLQYGGDAVRVAINSVPDAFSNVLIDQNDINVTPFEEGFERLFDVRVGRILVHDQEIQCWLLCPIYLTDSSQQKANTRILVSNYGNQLSSGSRNGHSDDKRVTGSQWLRRSDKR